MVKASRASPGRRWIALSYRNSLLIQSSAMGILSPASSDDSSLLADPFLKVACCVDSLPHFEPNYFDNKTSFSMKPVLLFPTCLLALLSADSGEMQAKFTEALRRANGFCAGWVAV